MNLFGMIIGVGMLVGQPAGPLATVNGRVVDREVLGRAMAEIAGGLALEEEALDETLALEPEVARSPISEREKGEEKVRLLESIREEAGANEEQAGVLLDSLRRARGLGPARFEALLWRNAALRRMVGPQEPTAEEVAAAMALETGPRVRLRMYSNPELNVVGRVRSESVRPEGEDEAGLRAREFRLAERASKDSTDGRAGLGGLVADVSESDPSLPAGLRAVLGGMKPGDVSEVVATEGGYCFALLESRTPGRAATEEDRARVVSRLRRRLERLAMERAARDVAARAKVMVFEPSLRWSWEQPRP